ncbi:MAG TPA: 5'-nucleotidase C-terminal domain-containing protein [Labilithrix sp.]|nr:5'-nucleotidase C-terminal domain-containing protein [Labilithrix sp.]
MTTSSRGPTVRIVAVNDVYSLENLPRLRTLVKHHRETDPADLFLVTLAGDFVAPSILSSLDFGRAMVECMRMIGVTHAILGNHEDDIPIEALRSRIAELGATFLATNVSFEPPLPKSQVLTVGRVRLGLVGVVMIDEATYRRPPFGGGELRPPNAAARAEAARLMREEHCTVVVPLTHQTLTEDCQLARDQRDPVFPVIIGGHEHVVVLEEIEGTWIEKAGADAFHAAVVDLAWPASPPAGAADLPAVRVRMDEVADYAEDAELRAVVNGHLDAVRELQDAALRSIPPGETLSSVGARRQQTSMGTLVCTSVREALGADGCLINGGGIRGSHEYRGRLTYADVKTEVPFDNEIVVAMLPGRVLRDAVAVSRARAPAESGSFLQVDDGIVVGEDGVVTSIGGAPLDLERPYAIALVRNLLSGLDRIEPLVRWARENPEHVPPIGCGRETKQIIIEAFSLAIWRTLGGFDAVDTDRDGLVTEAEVLAAMGDHHGRSRITARLVVAALDRDADLMISREEADGPPVPPSPHRC